MCLSMRILSLQADGLRAPRASETYERELAIFPSLSYIHASSLRCSLFLSLSLSLSLCLSYYPAKVEWTPSLRMNTHLPVVALMHVNWRRPCRGSIKIKVKSIKILKHTLLDRSDRQFRKIETNDFQRGW